MNRVTFDQAASDYEAARGFPPGVADVVADAALALLGGCRQALEVGVGTGRIARPLLARGVPVIGLDLSPGMLGHLLLQLPAGAPRPALVLGDALFLPLAAAAFDAVITVHLLHLLPNWRAALDEARRVLRSSGVFLSGFDWRPPDSPGARLLVRWRELLRAAGQDVQAGGAHDFSDIQAALLESGARLEERMAGEWSVTRTLSRQIETIEHRTWSGAANVPPDLFPRCLAELRAWAAETFGGLDRAYTVAHRFLWQRYTWPSGGRGG
jgi:SAM-dependent methyltransferase